MSAIDCNYKMVAIASLEHAGVKYEPGQDFIVETGDTRQFHLTHKSARDADPVKEANPAPPLEQSAQHTSKVPNGKSIVKRPVNRN